MGAKTYKIFMQRENPTYYKEKIMCKKYLEIKKQKNKKDVVSLVFAVDDNYAPCLYVALKSIFDNASTKYKYNIYVLNSGLSKLNIKRLCDFNTAYSSIEFIDVEEKLNKISDKLFLRDYFSLATYYRFFIPELFPSLDKILYLDSDIIVKADISELFFSDIKDNLAGVVYEEVMERIKVFGDYVEEGLGIPCKKYFNAGVMLLNLKELRKINVEQKFINLIEKHKFEVTQDQDYLNVILKDRCSYFDLGWNKTPFKEVEFDKKDLKIIHYKLSFKPWLYDDVLYSEYFWKYAAATPYYFYLKSLKDGYTEENKERDNVSFIKLMDTAKAYILSPFTYKKIGESI